MRRRIRVETLRGGMIWLLGFTSAFVFVEPSPYELVGLLGIGFFVLTGLTLLPALTPLLLLLVLLNVGYAMALVQVINQSQAVVWVLVSVFLATTAILYASMLCSQTQRRLELLMRGCLAAAVITSLLAIGAYFRLFGGISDVFLLYGRARATFNDPNVLGGFLVLPGLLLYQRLLLGERMLRNALLLLPIAAALFLTFSRGAWGQFVFAALLVMILAFISTQSSGARVRIILVAVLGLTLILAAVAVLLSIGEVADLFKERATLDQSYDLGRYGRFGRYVLGAEVALEHPFGIGPLQFGRYFTEDPHNTFLNAFMSGGWLGGFSYVTLCAVTAVLGLRVVLVPTPWQRTYQVLYAAYITTIVESAIIDIDHWRAYFLMLGALWGVMAASRNFAAAPVRSASYPGSLVQ
ncbi:MAG: O-antigen ligase family protein [Xanthobacteraceae bacterium]